jgi:hypothetical protein
MIYYAVVEFAHKTLGCPPLSTFLHAVKNNYIRFPGLTVKMILRNPPNSRHTTFGRMDAVRQNFQSTKLQNRPRNTGPKPDQFFHDLASTWDNDEFHLEDTTDGANEELHPNSVYYRTYTMYGDATGQFPVTSNEGHTHMMLFYHTDTRKTEVVGLKSTSEASAAAIKYFNTCNTLGHHTAIYCLDNVVDPLLRDHVATTGLRLQLVPPGQHRRNTAERIIRAFKNHFTSILPPSPAHDYVARALRFSAFGANGANPISERMRS